MLVDQELAAEDVRCPAKLRLPEIIREDHNWSGAVISVIRLFDDPAQRWADTQDPEIAAGYDFAGNGFRIAACRDAHLDVSAAEDTVEEPGLLLEAAADGVGHQVPGAEPAADLLAVPIYKDEAGGVADGERVQDHLIDQRVDGGGGADA